MVAHARLETCCKLHDAAGVRMCGMHGGDSGPVSVHLTAALCQPVVRLLQEAELPSCSRERHPQQPPAAKNGARQSPVIQHSGCRQTTDPNSSGEVSFDRPGCLASAGLLRTRDSHQSLSRPSLCGPCTRDSKHPRCQAGTQDADPGPCTSVWPISHHVAGQRAGHTSCIPVCLQAYTVCRPAPMHCHLVPPLGCPHPPFCTPAVRT